MLPSLVVATAGRSALASRLSLSASCQLKSRSTANGPNACLWSALTKAVDVPSDDVPSRATGEPATAECLWSARAASLLVPISAAAKSTSVGVTVSVRVAASPSSKIFFHGMLSLLFYCDFRSVIYGVEIHSSYLFGWVGCSVFKHDYLGFKTIHTRGHFNTKLLFILLLIF